MIRHVRLFPLRSTPYTGQRAQATTTKKPKIYTTTSQSKIKTPSFSNLQANLCGLASHFFFFNPPPSRKQPTSPLPWAGGRPPDTFQEVPKPKYCYHSVTRAPFEARVPRDCTVWGEKLPGSCLGTLSAALQRFCALGHLGFGRKSSEAPKTRCPVEPLGPITTVGL